MVGGLVVTGFPKPESRARERKATRADAERMRRAAYRQVTAREGRLCRVCLSPADPAALDLMQRGEHHHLTFRSRGGHDTTGNLVLICAACHADVHAHRLTITGDDANGPLSAGWPDTPARTI